MRRTIACSVARFTLTVADNPLSLAQHEIVYLVYLVYLVDLVM
jgi:hypothetical protein